MTTKHMTRKATRHVNQNEGLIFEKSSPGKAAWKLPPLDVPEVHGVGDAFVIIEKLLTRHLFRKVRRIFSLKISWRDVGKVPVPSLIINN